MKPQSTDGKLDADDLSGLAQWHDKLARDAISECEAEAEESELWEGICDPHAEEARNHRHTADALAELAQLRQFRDDVVTVLERGYLEDQLRLNCRLNSYNERSELLISGILADEAAAIRQRNEGGAK